MQKQSETLYICVYVCVKLAANNNTYARNIKTLKQTKKHSKQNSKIALNKTKNIKVWIKQTNKPLNLKPLGGCVTFLSSPFSLRVFGSFEKAIFSPFLLEKTATVPLPYSLLGVQFLPLGGVIFKTTPFPFLHWPHVTKRSLPRLSRLNDDHHHHHHHYHRKNSFDLLIISNISQTWNDLLGSAGHIWPHHVTHSSDDSATTLPRTALKPPSLLLIHEESSFVRPCPCRAKVPLGRTLCTTGFVYVVLWKIEIDALNFELARGALLLFFRCFSHSRLGCQSSGVAKKKRGGKVSLRYTTLRTRVCFVSCSFSKHTYPIGPPNTADSWLAKNVLEKEHSKYFH